MKIIRICIGSNDGETVAKSHMGDTRFFHIYDIFENLDNRFIEKRINIARDMEHAKADKMKEIIKLLEDTDVFIAQQKSPNFVKIAKNTRYQPVVVKTDRILDALILLGNSFEEIDGYVTRRKNAELFDTIPEMK